LVIYLCKNLSINNNEIINILITHIL
jgi:hypothetical protein